jgi:hypothetical protein
MIYMIHCLNTVARGIFVPVVRGWVTTTNTAGYDPYDPYRLL